MAFDNAIKLWEFGPVYAWWLDIIYVGIINQTFHHWHTEIFEPVPKNTHL